MFNYMTGELVELREDGIVLEVNDIGYEMLMNDRDLVNLQGRIGRIRVRTFLQVREDGMQLFGFLSGEDCRIFHILKEVSGIGPKTALGILSHMDATQLSLALAESDVKSLTGCPGVGKKTAQRMILELSGKLVREDVSVSSRPVAAEVSSAVSDAYEALIQLGFQRKDIQKITAGMDNMAEQSTEDIIKYVLTNV
ncbi:MAG: Holliday junction branch migration protein RuvA [Eubacteriales bacterium]|nr:Holliday junction branch migration protein RuvA [Eubacteriales bacterium]